MNLKILCTCNDPELLPAATMVFDTIRVGFPNAHIHAFGNNGFQPYGTVYDKWNNCSYLHHQWIEMLVQTEQSPFLICDTDMIFWKSFEQEQFSSPIAGRLIPAFFDRFTKATTMPRLHTSLMFINPVAVRKELEAVEQWIRPSRFNPIINPFYPVQIPGKNGDIFYDTCALLYHAIGGQSFTESQLDCYDHLNAGTWIKELNPSYAELGWLESHKRIYNNPKSARGLWRAQDAFYAANRPASVR